MDNETAKQILSAYRQDGADLESSEFQEALQLCHDDPEMETWLREEQARDAQMIAALRSIKAPAHGKNAVLETAFIAEETSSHRRFGLQRRAARWWALGSIAATVALAALVWRTLDPAPTSGPSYALTEYAHGITELDFADTSVTALNAWLSERGAPTTAGLPASLHDEQAVGCAVFNDRAGNPVSMVCLSVDTGLVHVFIMDPDSPIAKELPQGQWISSDGLNLYAWSSGAATYAITTDMSPAAVDAAIGASLHRAAS